MPEDLAPKVHQSGSFHAFHQVSCLVFAGLSVDKVYWAVVEDFRRPESEGTIDAMVVSEDKGKPFSVPALTEYKVMARGSLLTWLELKPISGEMNHGFSP